MKRSSSPGATHWISVLLLLLCVWPAKAQVELFLEVNPNPSPLIYTWGEGNNVMVFTDNFTTSTVQAELRFTLYNMDDEVVGQTLAGQGMFVDLAPGPSTIMEPAIFGPSSFLFNQPWRGTVQRTAQLPEGEYRLCGQLYDLATGQPIGQENCGFFIVIGFEPPLLTFPPNGYFITPDGLMNLVFQWTPLIHPFGFTSSMAFQFRLVEVYEGQTAEEAILVNSPLVEEFTQDIPQFIWPENLIGLPDSHYYAWTVRGWNFSQSVPLTEFVEPNFIKVTNSDSTITRPPPTEEDDGDDPRDTPPPTYYGEELDDCNPPRYETLKENEISVGVVLEQPQEFPYPRAVPLRAEAYDWDLVRWICTGCGPGQGEQYEPVRDKILAKDITWELMGKGSLNSPITLEKIDSVQQAMDDAEARRDEINDSLPLIDSLVDTGIDEAIDRLDDEIADLDKLISRIDSIIQALTERVDSLIQVRQEKITKMQTFYTRIDSARQAIAAHQETIDSIQGVLDGEPSVEEMQLQQEMQNVQQQVDALRNQMGTKEEEISLTAQQLRANIDQAEQQLQQAAQQYQQLKAAVDAISQEIRTIETQLMRDKRTRQYLQRLREWRMRSSQFIQQYAGMGSNLFLNQQSVRDAANQTLSTANPSERQTRYIAYNNGMGALLQNQQVTCSQLSGNARTNCLDAYNLVQESATRLTAEMDSLLPTNFRLNRAAQLRIDSLRQELDALEPQLQSAGQQASAALTAYNDALEEYDNRLLQLGNELESLEADYQIMADSLAGIQARYQQKRTQRIQHLDNHRAEYIARQEQMGTRIDGLSIRISRYQDSVRILVEDTLPIGITIRVLREEIKVKEEEKAILEDTKRRLEEQKRKLEEEKERLEDRRDPLNEELEDLEEALEALREALNNLKAPQTTATGYYVYYLPPPLEEVMQDKPEFERLKERVAIREAQLAAAKSEKAGLQGKLVNELEKIAIEAEKYATTKKQLEDLKEQETELDDDIKRDKTRKTHEFNERRQQQQEKIQEAETDIDSINAKIARLVGDSVRLADEIENLKQQIEEEDSILQALEEQLMLKMDQLEFEEEQLKRAKQTLAEKTLALQAAREELLEKKEKLAQARNALTRAAAQEDDSAIASARNEVQQLEAEVRGHENNVLPSLEGQVQSASGSVASAEQRTQNATQQKQDAWKAYSDHAGNLDHKLRDSLIAKNNHFEAVVKSIRHFRKVKMQKEGIKQQLEDERAGLTDSVNTAVNNDEDIKNKTAELNKIKEQIKAAETALKESEENINASIQKKEKLKDEIEEKIKKAQDDLLAVKDSLREFLLKEFNEVQFDLKLKLTVENNTPYDQFRTQDEKKIETNQLRYPGKREPQFEDLKADDSPPDKPPVPANCIPDITYNPASPSGGGGIKKFDEHEPRTIALMYKNGEPLWPEWPVIPDSIKKLLAKDVIRVNSSFSDDPDDVIKVCVNGYDCDPATDPKETILDLGYLVWQPAKGEVVNQFSHWQQFFWGVPLVDTPKPKDQIFHKASYIAKGLGEDDEVKDQGLIEIHPGVLIEVPQLIRGAPGDTVKIKPRVVTGDHKGLGGEKVEFEVKLLEGSSEGYMIVDNGDSLYTEITDGDGYAEIEFDLGDGFANYEMTVKWKRGTTVIQAEKIRLEAPLYHKMLKMGSAPLELAWQKALEWFDAGSSVSTAELDELAAAIGEEENPEKADGHFIAGLTNLHHDWVNEKKLTFECENDDIKVDPEEAETEVIGIGRTKLTGIDPDDEELSFSVTSTIEEKYEPVTEPPTVTGDWSNKKIEEFYIGKETDLFLVKLDNPIREGETIDGTGVLKPGGNMRPDHPLINKLLDQKVSNHAVEVELQGDRYVAVKGDIALKPEPALSVEIRSFKIELDSFAVKAQKGAGIGGTIKRDTMSAVVFWAELDATGNFLGKVSNLPSISLAGFTIKEGTAFTLDMHAEKSPPGFAQEDFMGVVIHKADIELPKALSRKDATEPSRLVATEVYVGTQGFGGSISYVGTTFKLGFGGFEFAVDSLALEFDKSEFKSGALRGSLTLPMPMEGTITTLVSYSSSQWVGQVSTDNPVAIPRISTTFTLLNGTGITYKPEEELAELRINAFIVSDYLGEMEIKDFMINSNGEVEAEKITIEKEIEFSSGFAIHVKTLSFRYMQDGYGLEVEGGFKFEKIGVDQLDGKVSLAPGPKVSVEFTNAQISFERKPVTFAGSFSYSGREFKGEFEVGIDKICPQGIEGLLIIGNTEDEQDITYSYWYAQLSIPVKIPIGQTGLAFLSFGGGVGYNYLPPVLGEQGGPAHNDGFSLKAMIWAGTLPGGEVFAGQMEMVLVPGKFTLAGKVWLLDQEESIYGSGQLNLQWAPVAQMDGYIRMFVGIPDADGDIFQFTGQINFLYNSNEAYIQSETIEGSFMKALYAKAEIEVNKEHTYLAGRLWYNLDKEFGFDPLKVIVVINVQAHGSFDYNNVNERLDVAAGFLGEWDVDLSTPLGDADIIYGRIRLDLELTATPTYVEGKGEAEVSYSIWFYSNSHQLDVGFRYNI